MPSGPVQEAAVAGNFVGTLRVHLAVALVQDQLQAARQLELAAHWHLCSQHASMHG